MEIRGFFAVALIALLPGVAAAQEQRSVNYLGFAQGAVPVATGGATAEFKTGMEHALKAIDGDPEGFVATPKPGAAESEVWFVYRLPAATTFTSFSIPRVLETPSPAQTFFKEVKVSGGRSADGPFEALGSAVLATHKDKQQVTRFAATVKKPVLFVKLSLRGGIKMDRDKGFFEFSEIIGEGKQEPVPLLKAFTGKWKGRGVLVELAQDGANVSGCYDTNGELKGAVSGNLLRASGTDRSTNVRSSFVLTVEGGNITGVRSTNGAPFKLYAGSSDPKVTTKCSKQPVKPPGCGDVVYGIQFDYDSAVIRNESKPVLDALYTGLKGEKERRIAIVGHTSSEGADDYNRALSQRRAASVVTALSTRGIDAKRLSAEGLGETKPIADNDNEAGRSLNRRVEIVCR